LLYDVLLLDTVPALDAVADSRFLRMIVKTLALVWSLLVVDDNPKRAIFPYINRRRYWSIKMPVHKF